ncbi:LAFE_0H07448g1_1 [Lachancea fermentati]|uniref:LAFE_0H07448g1_1 n=1 Tax=Lachancea fermentati TaxID=4955 RepID=A0A1G4MJW3_LACFM|nr:LAFE_0H07448g1_1 [Lachancea fermentati]
MQDTTESLSQMQKILDFRDKKVLEQDPESFTFKRMMIERRLRKAAVRHQENERNYSIGRLDRVDTEYLETMCMDYSVLKMAGIAFRSENDTASHSSQTIEKEDALASEVYEQQHFTMDGLISKELNNDKGSRHINHVHKDRRLIENAVRNTEIVKSLLANDSAKQEEQKNSTHNNSPGELLSCTSNTRLAQNQNASGLEGLKTDPPQNPTSKTISRPKTEAYYETGNKNQQNLSTGMFYGANNSPLGAANNYSNLKFEHCQPSSFPFDNSSTAPSQELESSIKGYVSSQNVAYNFPQQSTIVSPPPTSQLSNSIEIKKSRSGTLPPRQVSKPKRNDGRSKAPKALRKMENVAKKYDL